MTTTEAFIAASRFGLGAKPGELAEAAADPRGWLERQLGPAPALPAPFADLPPGSRRLAELRERRRNKDAAERKAMHREMRAAYLAEAAARTRAQVLTDAPFRERLVAFWSNHFTVSVERPPLLALAGAFEREAIRPHVTGRFADMLLAAVRHPAMLIYLDNAHSIGPNSRVGRRRGRGLNENLAREVLELHTLGVDGGYAQRDVREFAKILTGWSVPGPRHAHAGRFRFHGAIHEPGEKTLLGVRYAEAGMAEGEAALAALARHPSTAAHVAAKLARHFIADEPPPAAVDRITGVFLETGGDLGEVARAVIASPEAWAEPLPKVKSPNEFVVSALRATGLEGEGKELVHSLRALGQAPFAAPSPAGWPDTAEQWIGPESVLRRAEWAMALAHRARGARRPDDVLAAAIGPVATLEVRLAVKRAPSQWEALALVLASPEFQRR